MMKSLFYIIAFYLLLPDIYAQKIEAKSGTIHVKKPADKIQFTETVETGSFQALEEMPQFPGGERALMLFLNSNIQYPDEAKENGVSGIVYVSIRVSSKGEFSGARILSSPDSLLSNEALRVVNMMPSWKPGTLRGKPVNSVLTLPIRFVLK